MVVIYKLNRVAYELYRNQEFGQYRKYHVHATVRDFKPDIDDVIYKGCRFNYCKKKLQPRNDGWWYCVKCDSNHSDFQYRYKLRAYLCDGSMRPFSVTMFDDTASLFLEISAPDLAIVHDYNHSKYDKLFEEAVDQTCYFKLKVALVRYGGDDNPRIRLNGIVTNFGFD